MFDDYDYDQAFFIELDRENDNCTIEEIDVDYEMELMEGDI